MASSSSSSVSSSFTLPWKYDVFLSFRGEDTRKNFTDHLYTTLKKRGIITFRDDERLERGKEIEPSLLKAIEDSRFAIVIFSTRYADSTWCLEELAKILDCHEEKGQTVLPIFYDVTPSEVQEQTGGFGLDLDKHEEAFRDNKGKVEKWRLALKKVGNLAGWDVVNKYQSQIVAEIVDRVSSTVQPTFSTVLEGLVGMDFRLKELKDYLTMARDDVNFIGIHGMGGIGKTTMARVLFDMFESQYEGSSFLANIREVTKKKGLVHLQKQLLSEILKEKDLEVWDDVQVAAQIKRVVNCRKVFLVFDDLDKLEQLQRLAGKHDWFGCGSIIIITTRDEHLLTNHGVDYIYNVKGLDDNHARDLLFLNAFKKTSPTNEHFVLAKDVIRYVKGLPLAVEVLGKHLCDRGIEKWQGLLDRLREIPDDEIIGRLRISYDDGLQDVDKKLFLDIACFFKGKPINWVKNILDKHGYGIEKLREKSLIKFFHDQLWMHDLIQEMGWKIVHDEHPNKPERRSRLWTSKDFCHLATNDTATEMVEGIMVDDPPKKPLRLNGKIFSSMYNLRLLKISNVRSVKGLTFLSSELRVLEWPEYPVKLLPQSFETNNLVELKMSSSKVKYLWKGIKWCEMLKTIELCHSCNLIKTPDFTGIPNLERLDLEECARLHKVHESIGILSKLVELNLKNCKSLVSLPNKVSGMKSLKILILHGCSKLEKLPSDVEEIECLEKLDVGETALIEWPSSIAGMRKLDSLSLSGIKGPNDLPPPISFQSLTSLTLSGLNLRTLPDSIGSMFSLDHLDLGRNNFVSLPASMSQLSKLTLLNLDECQRLQSINVPSPCPSWVTISANGCTSLGRLGAIGCPFFINVGSVGYKAHYFYRLDFSNCVELLRNQDRTYDEIVKWTQKWIQGTMKYVDKSSCTFDVIVPGSDILYWINVWSDVDTIIMKLPPYWYDHLLGVVFCAIIQPNEVYDPQEDGWSITFDTASFGEWEYKSDKKFICDHLLLRYESSFKANYADITCYTRGPITVKKWGIRPVYFEDLENMEGTRNIGRIYETAKDETDLPSFEVLDKWPHKRNRGSYLTPLL